MDPFRQLMDIDYHEISHFEEVTRLRFNALARVRVYLLNVRAGDRAGQAEVWHWVEADEWELVHTTLPD